MKKRYFIFHVIVFLSLFFSCQKPESVPENCDYSQQIYDSLHRDALYLYVHDIYSDSLHPNRNQPEIDQAPVKRILGQFQAILDLQIPETDTVFNILPIKAVVTNTRIIALKVNPNAPEIQALIEGQPTGNTTLDEVINQYHFDQVETLYSYPDFNWLTITSRQDWNLIPIKESLEGLPFIENIDALCRFGLNPTRIVKTAYPAYTEYDFVYGWGDCPAGCINERHWVFQVNNTTCEASFSSSYGDIIPIR